MPTDTLSRGVAELTTWLTGKDSCTLCVRLSATRRLMVLVRFSEQKVR